MDSRSDSEGTEIFHQDKPHCLPPCLKIHSVKILQGKTATKTITYINNSYSGLEKNSCKFQHQKNRLSAHMVAK